MHFFSLLVALAVIPCIHAFDYHVIFKAQSTHGGSFFETQIREDFAKEKMEEAANFIWKTFKQDRQYTKKNVQEIKLIIDAEDCSRPYHIHEEIHLSAKAIEEHLIGANHVKISFTEMLYLLVTNVLQWDNAGIPPGLREGIARYITLKAGYQLGTVMLKVKENDRWDQGGDVTVQFLVYWNRLKVGFVAGLNEKMKYGYKESYIRDLLGVTVEEAWNQFRLRRAR